jgi:hybrid cluster-associated redox disulfide protein
MPNKNQHLHLQMNVADLMNEWPQVIPVFLRHHMACVGCSMSAFETLGDAATIYGMTPQAFLDELTRAIFHPGDSPRPE